MATTQPLSFLSIPAELRLQIYDFVMDTTPTPRPVTMYEYRGLILSCRQINAEFEAEAVKRLQRSSDRVHDIWDRPDFPLTVAKPTRLSDSMKVVIGLPKQYFLGPTDFLHVRKNTLGHLVAYLLTQFSRFSIIVTDPAILADWLYHEAMENVFLLVSLAATVHTDKVALMDSAHGRNRISVVFVEVMDHTYVVNCDRGYDVCRRGRPRGEIPGFQIRSTFDDDLIT